MSQSPQDILSALDKELAKFKWCGPPSDLSHLQDPNHLSVFKQLGDFEQVISQWVFEKVKGLIQKHGLTEFQFCSVGCEDASLDLVILQKLAKALPDMKFKYTGINGDECEVAEETLSELGPNFQVELVVRDYEELTKDGLQPFDFILMANCTYHASSLELMLSGATRLLKPNTGELVIVSSRRQSIDELITRFYSHQRTYELYTAETVIATLDKLGIRYTQAHETVTFDLTQQFWGKFESEEALMVLDHLVFTRLQDYPPRVAELCVEFLEKISTSDGSRRIVTTTSDLIVVHRK